MRLKTLGVLTLCGMMAGTLAVAQTASKGTSATTVDDIICKMSDSCGQDAAANAPRPENGAEKTFSFQVSGPKASPSTAAAPSAMPAPAKKQPAYYAASGGKKAAPVAQTQAPASDAHTMTMEVHFLKGSAQLSDDTTVELSKYAEAMRSPKMADLKFVIGGHTDSSGSRATNMDLSQRRAQAVADYLTTNGVPGDRLIAKGYGPDQPMAGTKASNALNRRVELVRAD